MNHKGLCESLSRTGTFLSFLSPRKISIWDVHTHVILNDLESRYRVVRRAAKTYIGRTGSSRTEYHKREVHSIGPAMAPEGQSFRRIAGSICPVRQLLTRRQKRLER